MKKILLTVLIICGLAWSAYCIADDAIHHTGAFMSTATYREYVQEGKR